MGTSNKKKLYVKAISCLMFSQEVNISLQKIKNKNKATAGELA